MYDLRPGSRTRHRRWPKAGIAALALVLGAAAVLPLSAAAPEPAAAPKTVCILFSRDIPPYREAAEGAKAGLEKAGPYRCVEVVMTGQNTEELTKRIMQTKPDLVLTLGTEATKTASMQVENVPIVFAMVANPVDSGILPRKPSPDQQMAGVTTDVAPARQFEFLKQAVPGAKRIAVIYCPQYTEATVAAGEKAAKAGGLELVRFPVEPYRVDDALDKLSKETVDAVWTVTDPGVMVTATARRILTFALKAKVPVIGFSPAMVRAGALMGFGIDNKAIGVQAGAVAAAVLKGKKPAEFNLVYPADVTLILNSVVAQRIEVKLPEALVAKAQMINVE